MPNNPYAPDDQDYQDFHTLGTMAGYIPDSAPQDEPETAPIEESDAYLTPPSYVPHNLEDPGVQNANPLLPSPGPSSYAVGTSSRGFSEQKYGQVKKKESDLDRDLRMADQQAQAGETRYETAASYGHDSAVDAARKVTDATVDKVLQQGQGALVFQKLNDDFATEEMKANADATAQANQSKADYIAALADFRASKVDPSQLWHNMNGGERFGMLATAFVHDFLGARGINTSAMATFNKAIDRNIDAQIQAIKTKGEVAEGFKSLWWMQRNQASSDTEARARVRGFLLEGAKQQVVANMAQYESALASAQGQAAVAAIDGELSKNLIEIYKHTDANAIALRNQALDKWKAKLQASLEQQSLNLKSQELDLKKAEAGKQSSIEPVVNPESGKFEYYFMPWVQKEERIKVREQLSGMESLNKDFQDLRELARNAKSNFDPINGTRFAPEDQQNFDALAVRMAHNFARANGERATDADVQDFLKSMRAKTWLNQADAEKVIAFSQNNILRPSEATVKNYLFDLPSDSPLRNAGGATVAPFQGARTEAKNTSNPPPETPTEILRKEAGKVVSGKQGQVPLDEISSDVARAHELAVKEYPNLFTKNERPTVSVGKSLLYGRPEISQEKTKEPVAEPAKKFEWGMVRLRDLARSGDETSLSQLQSLANPYLSGLNHDDPESAFAALMLTTVSKDFDEPVTQPTQKYDLSPVNPPDDPFLRMRH
jgi:hypothetical protein